MSYEPQHFRLTRVDLVRYAGASGDFNQIHFSDRVAAEVGLPGVIAHGMLTLGLVGSAVATWTGYAEVVELGGKFTSPVVVPDDEVGAEIVLTATKVVGGEDGLTTISIEATCDGKRVLGNPKAIVRLPK